MFFNELDLLEIRLHVLAEVVDRFVLVEARQTFQRGEKPLYYAENRARFLSFADRIDHVVVDEFPAEATDPFACESWQRNAIGLGIGGAENGDTILISDADEIPKPEAVVAAACRGGVSVFRQLAFYYFLNCMLLREDGTQGTIWSGTVAYRHDSRAQPPQRYSDLRWLRGWEGDRLRNRARAAVRRARRSKELEGRARFLNDAGWHFTYLGGVPSVIAKLEAYSHVEYNTDRFKDPGAISRAIEGGYDLFGGPAKYKWVPVDGRFPGWLQQNATTRYGHLLAPEKRHVNQLAPGTPRRS